jgi:hypothetical protein
MTSPGLFFLEPWTRFAALLLARFWWSSLVWLLLLSKWLRGWMRLPATHFGVALMRLLASGRLCLALAWLDLSLILRLRLRRVRRHALLVRSPFSRI